MSCATAPTTSSRWPSAPIDFLSERTPGTPKIRCETVPLTTSGGRKAISVIEIVNDDMPFLVDSVMGELAERRLDVRLVAHPMFGVRRDNGKLVALSAPDAQSKRESFIHIHLASIIDDAAREELVRALEVVLGEVRVAVQDWKTMRARVDAIVADLKDNPPPLPVGEIAEAVQFLQWLLADNFTFLGLRDYRVDGQALEPDFKSALGIMRSRELRVLKRGNELLEFTPEIMAFLKEPRPLIIAKANIHSRVHRRAYLDYIGVKRFDASGTLIGEHRIIGLFTSTAYTRSAHSIPYLRRKIAAVEARAGFDPGSHSGKALANVLEHYPRDELFQIDEDTLAPSRRRSCSSTSARACVCSRGTTASIVSFRCWCSCRANVTTAIFAQRSVLISRAPSSDASRRSIRISPAKGRWCACISSSAGPAAAHHRTSIARHSNVKSRRSSAPGPTG